MDKAVADLPVIIEVRVNEDKVFGRDSDNPALPRGPKDIIREAIRAWEAGASILHWHGRDPATGLPSDDPALYRDVYEGVRAESDLLLNPTLASGPAAEDRVRHVLAVVDDPSLRVEMAPVTFGTLNADYWDPVSKRFRTTDQISNNSRATLEAVLEILKRHHVYVKAMCWEVGHVRTARCFQEMGLLARDTFWEFVFTGEAMPSGPAPTIPALRAFLAEIPAGDTWLAMCTNGDAMPLAAWAITLGGHVAIGLGDYHYDRFGAPHHGELIEKVASLARTLGRPVATPDQTREILKLRSRPDLPKHRARSNATE